MADSKRSLNCSGWQARMNGRRKGCLHYENRTLFLPASFKGCWMPKFTCFTCCSSARFEFQNVKQNPNNSWLAAKDTGSADKFTIRSRRLPVLGWRLVLISHADSKQQYCSNTDAVYVSDQQHFRTLWSIFGAKLVFTVYTLTLVDSVAFKYATLSYDA